MPVVPPAAQSLIHPSGPPPDPALLASARTGPRDGLVWLDSATGAAGGTSLLATAPQEILRGNIFTDAGSLRQVLHSHRTHKPPAEGIVPGGLFGWVDFGGDYTFGLYDECHVRRQHAGWADRNGPWMAPGGAQHLDFVPQMEKSAFCERVRKAKAYIAAGDIYQVNLSYPWIARWPQDLDPLDFYLRLRRSSPAPFGAFLDLGGTQVFSASPECFLKLQGRQVVTRPIKGTRPRGADAAADGQLARVLAASPKERAELVMITDLERNDLGQVCEFGSIRVTGLLDLERYAQVQHLVSTVEGTLRPDVDHVAAFQACFPGGSISGAPKKRALEIIHELEPHRRGLYTGAIGWFGFNGGSQFSIAIRTAWRTGDQVEFHTGSGIVADSDPDFEWEETRHKASGMLAAAGA